jgi:vancomycin resistance protein YoaR
MKIAPEIVAVAAVLILGAFLVLRVHPAPDDGVIASYSTDLSQRTPHQRYNARRAAAAIDGVVIAPGKTFSFDDTLHGWTADQGFLKAPVSYDGTLVDDYGGGVCETSTTIYNAALLAGLPILERHAHSFAPSYAPPGRDAAVAYPSADLKFKNDNPWPITLHVRPWGSRLVCRIQALYTPADQVRIRAEILGTRMPAHAPVQPGSGQRRSRWQLLGREGVRVAIFRTWYAANGDAVKTEQVSDNTYLPISRVDWGM